MKIKKENEDISKSIELNKNNKNILFKMLGEKAKEISKLKKIMIHF